MPRRSAASLHFPAFTRVERLTPPPELSPDERALFIDIVSATPAGHFRASDLPLICSYARAILLEREAAAHLAAQGHVSIDNKPSAWLGIQGVQDDAVARPGAEADADRAQAVPVTGRKAAAAD